MNSAVKPKHHRASWFVQQRLLEGVEKFADLEARISRLATNQEIGDAFEVFAEAYLATQPQHQATQVWPGQAVPPSIVKRAGLTDRDFGVDGVVQTHDGDLHAYQVKFRSDRAALGWGDISTFMGLADRVAQRVLFTNVDELPTLLEKRTNFYAIRGSDLDRLQPDDFAVLQGWLEAVHVPREVRAPRPHQLEALADIVPALGKPGARATAVMPCASGKTLVGFWAAQRLQARRILVLLPSLALLRQTLHEYLKEAPCTYLCVCSDASVEKGLDALEVRLGDLDFPVTTDARVVRRFLAQKQPVVVFSTYQSAKVVAQGMPKGTAFDLGIFDEAHKTAGREGAQFGFALKDRHLKIKRRLFMTATPRHYDIRRRNAQGDPVQVYSMDQPAVYGPVVHTLSFAAAVARKLIVPFKVLISVVTQEHLEARFRGGEVVVDGMVVKARQVANAVAVQKAVEKYGISKIFSFHRSVDSAKSFVSPGGEGISYHLPEFKTFHVNGEMPTAKRDGHLKEFAAAPGAAMSNARCLTEGVDLPAVDMVAFMAPKQSRIDIVQAAGRAMRLSSGKSHGYILLPVYQDEAAGEDHQVAIDRAHFGPVREVLHALAEHDDEFADIIREMREARGAARGYDDTRFRERVEVLGPELDLDLLRRSITVMTVDEIGVQWDEMYGRLLAYRDQHSDANVPNGYLSDPALSYWVITQRTRARAGLLSKERRQRLDAIGFQWDPHDAAWEATFPRLENYFRTYGHSNVPHLWEQDRALGHWVAGQRRRRKEDKSSPEQIKKLDALGFVWDLREAAWNGMLQKLKDYKQTHGHCSVPSNHPVLGKWVARQRTFSNRDNRGRLSAERRQRLTALDFVWDQRAAEWEIMFGRLAAYRARFGDCNVPAVYPDDRDLGQWVRLQRSRKQLRRITPDQIERLDMLGFVWNVDETAWESMFAALVEFKSQYGHCNVPRTWPQNSALASWVNNQRVIRRYWVNNQRANRDRLSAERQRRLTALGFVWDPTRYGAKLTETQVLEIRRLLTAGISRKKLARQFGVTLANIGAIVRRKSWSKLK